jgi:3-oxoacyl-[acyl-carrier protein] reductase
MPKMKLIDLTGKVAVVTGGSRGIGAAVCRSLAEAGANLVFTYQSDSKSAARVCAETAELGVDSLSVRANAARSADVRSVIAKAVRKFGRIDILVNNAGVWKRGEIGSMTEAQWDETLDVNLKGTFLFTNAVVPIMKKQRSGKIINIASTAGQRGEVHYSHYAASKAGMIGFTKAIGAELAPDNIIVNAVAPGWVDTDMSALVLHNKKLIAPINRAIPRGRVATAEDIANAVLFLASDLSNHLVGSTISVNGGSVLSN